MTNKKNTFKEFTKGKHYKVDFYTGCWNWLMCKNNRGYGATKYKGKRWLAHRLSYTLYKGKIPKGLLVCHTCDNPSCVNPNHLWFGTDQDNSDDKIKKGRDNKAKGENHCRCKLSDQEVFEIRNLYKNKIFNQLKLAKLYNVSRPNISLITLNKSRKIKST